jgi:hypothetical protein
MTHLDGTDPTLFTSLFATATVVPANTETPEPACFGIALLGLAVLGAIRGRVHGT